MLKWKLFMPDEPETYPELNKPLVLCDFRGILRKPTPAILTQRKDGSYWWDGGYIGECVWPMMWTTLLSLPKDPVIIEVKKCEGDRSCEWSDDGYCFDKPEDVSCDKIRIVHELSYK